MLAPYPLLGIAAALLLLFDFIALATLSDAPYRGFELARNEQQVLVTASDTIVPSGTVVSSLASSNQSITLSPDDFIEEPDMLASPSALATFFARQQVITDILAAAAVTIETVDGRQYTVDRPYLAAPEQPLSFGLQMLVGNIGFLVGIAVWSFQRNNMAARHFCITGIGLAIAAITAAVYSSRPVALPGPTFQLLSSLNHIGTLLFSAAFVSMMWHYPRALSQRWFAPWCYLAMAAAFLIDYAQLLPSLDYTRRLPPALVLVMSAGILTVQWRRSAGDLLTRQSLKWFIFITMSGSTFFVVTIMLPPALGLDPAVSQGAAFVAFLSIYLGLAVGVARYPLFDLDRYWTRTLYWALAGLGLVGADLLFIRVFAVTEREALLLAFALLGWLYFPLRSLATRYLFAKGSRSFEDHLPAIITGIASSVGTDLHDTWEKQLRALFSPLTCGQESFPVNSAVVVKRGLGLIVPGIDGSGSYLLEHADSGQRLFSSEDVALAGALQEVFRLAQSARSARDEGIKSERDRIKRDIHDSLGGRLLTILHSTSDPAIIRESRQAMNELRDILAAVEDQQSPLTATIEKWHHQALSQAEMFGARVDWYVDPRLHEIDWQVSGSVRLSLGRIIAEALTNALRHGAATTIAVTFSFADDSLLLAVANDGDCEDPGHWRAGNGLVNIRARAAELGGQVEWSLDAADHMRFTFTLPLGSGL